MYIINHVPYALHHNPFLNANNTQGQNFLKKTLFENKQMVFKNGVKTIQVVAYIIMMARVFSISTQISSLTNERTCQ